MGETATFEFCAGPLPPEAFLERVPWVDLGGDTSDVWKEIWHWKCGMRKRNPNRASLLPTCFAACLPSYFRARNISSLVSLPIYGLVSKCDNTPPQHKNRRAHLSQKGCPQHTWQWLEKAIPKWVALASGNMDQNLRFCPACFILSHTHMHVKKYFPGKPPPQQETRFEVATRCSLEPNPGPDLDPAPSALCCPKETGGKQTKATKTKTWQRSTGDASCTPG